MRTQLHFFYAGLALVNDDSYIADKCVGKVMPYNKVAIKETRLQGKHFTLVKSKIWVVIFISETSFADIPRWSSYCLILVIK